MDRYFASIADASADGFVPTKLREFLDSELGTGHCDSDTFQVQEIRAYVDLQQPHGGEFTVAIVLDVGGRQIGMVVDADLAMTAPSLRSITQNIH